MQEAYNGRKFRAGGADGHAVHHCFESFTSPTPRNTVQCLCQSFCQFVSFTYLNLYEQSKYEHCHCMM